MQLARSSLRTKTLCTDTGIGPVRGALGGVDELIGETLGNGLDVTEGRLAGAGGEQVQRLVHTAHRGHINGLPAVTRSSLATPHFGDKLQGIPGALAQEAAPLIYR